jgi:hypothetical protein
MLIGYARVSTRDQKPHLQLDALQEAGCERIFKETVSGAKRERPELQSALGACRKIKTGGLTFSGPALLGKPNPHSKRLPSRFLARNPLALSSFSAHCWDFNWFSGLTRRQHMQPFQIVGHGYQLPFARGRLQAS